MKLFQLDESYNVIFEPQVALIKQFAALIKRDRTKTQVALIKQFAVLIKRDRTKSKTQASKELAFVFFYCDIKSDYMIHTDPTIRQKSIMADLGIKDSWKIDSKIEDAIKFYESMSQSITNLSHQPY